MKIFPNRALTCFAGTIETPMVDTMLKTGDLSEEAATEGAPIKRLGKAEEVAEAVLWLFSPAYSAGALSNR